MKKNLPWSTQIAINIGAAKQFPNKTVLVTPSDTLSEDVKESLDKVCESKSKGACWSGKSKKWISWDCETRHQDSDNMGDLTTILLILLDFQIYKMVMRAEENSEIIMLAFIDMFVWVLAIISSHKWVIIQSQVSDNQVTTEW